MTLKWICKIFDELSPHELYKIIRLRNEIFVVEQNCVFQDADNKDQRSFHLMGIDGPYLYAYTRLVPAGISYNEASIGRVVVSGEARLSGFGKKLMLESIDQLYKLWGRQPIKIGAQLYLKKFYESFGFQQSSPVYDEDGIDHIEMLLA